MSAKARNLLKTRPQRDGEVLYHAHLKSGQADSQEVLWGVDLAVGAPTTTFTVNKGEVVLGGAVISQAGQANIAVPAGATTAAGNFRKVLVEVNAAGTVSTVVGTAVTTTQADAVLPAGDPTAISVGYLEIPASFTAGTTAVTAPMLKPVLYHA